MSLPIELDDVDEGACRDCAERDLERIDHPLNDVDWRIDNSSQSYQIYRCKACHDYWGCRHQWDAGTGNDDRWHRFGPSIPADARRHY